jgi:hypothetical protein
MNASAKTMAFATTSLIGSMDHVTAITRLPKAFTNAKLQLGAE